MPMQDESIVKDRIRSALEKLMCCPQLLSLQPRELCRSPVTEVGKQLRVWTDEEAAALQQYWFDQQSADQWWSARQPIEPLVRWGLTLAVRKAQEKNPPRLLQCLWTPGGRKFEVSLFWHTAMVSLIIHSPPIASVDNDEVSTPTRSVLPALTLADTHLPLDDNVVIVKRLKSTVASSPNLQILEVEDDGMKKTGWIVAERLKTEKWW